MNTTTFTTVTEAKAFAATVLVSSGGKTHLPTFGDDQHADGCTNTGIVRVALCGCTKRYSISPSTSSCGSLARVSRMHQDRYASHAGGFIARNGAMPTCTKCAKYA